jgi:putative spermidine/putrescine transport system permease protein
VLVVTLVLVAWANRVGGSVTALGAIATSGTKERS